MPLYEYQCDSCAHRFEIIQRYSDPPASVCPQCGGAVTKLLSSPAIQFKGTGWYITDYARAGKTDSGSPSSKTESASATAEKTATGSETTNTTSSESKTESSAPAKAESKTAKSES